MLVVCSSPKGGCGTTVVAASAAFVLARRAVPVRLLDLAGDVPALLGIVEPALGVGDWMAQGVRAAAPSIDRAAVRIVPHCAFVAAGDRAALAAAPPEVGAALGVVLRDGSAVSVVDAGRLETPAARALAEVADVVLVVVRNCYLALRGATALIETMPNARVVLVDEPHRTLTRRDVERICGNRLAGRIPVQPAIARVVDSGLLAQHVPHTLGDAVARVLATVGVAADEDAA